MTGIVHVVVFGSPVLARLILVLGVPFLSRKNDRSEFKLIQTSRERRRTERTKISPA